MPILRRSKETTAPRDEDRALRAERAARVEQAADPGAESARHRRIAERAYRRAEQRGFAPGQELDDWLAAEAEEDGRGDADESR